MKQSANDIAIRYLGNRDRTAFEIRKHLASKGFEEEEISSCLNYLHEYRLINDEDYCEKYIRYAMGKGRGPLRIRRELLDRGVAEEYIRTGLEGFFSGGKELEAAMSFVEKQASRGITLVSEKEVAKIGRQLTSQGYSVGVIYRILEKLRIDMDNLYE